MRNWNVHAHECVPMCGRSVYVCVNKMPIVSISMFVGHLGNYLTANLYEMLKFIVYYKYKWPQIEKLK